MVRNPSLGLGLGWGGWLLFFQLPSSVFQDMVSAAQMCTDCILANLCTPHAAC